MPAIATAAVRSTRTRPGLLIRELNPSDRRALAFLMRRLGDRSRYLRFLTATPNVDTEVDRVTGADHWHHEALIAISPAPRTPIGVTEYVRLDEFDLAELAIAVADDWQRRGVGRALLEALRTRVIATGVRRLITTVLPSNRAALALASQFGRLTVLESHRDLIELLVELTSEPHTAEWLCGRLG
jgi:RimJ/RimL family protein N-acetyltransferase